MEPCTIGSMAVFVSTCSAVHRLSLPMLQTVTDTGNLRDLQTKIANVQADFRFGAANCYIYRRSPTYSVRSRKCSGRSSIWCYKLLHLPTISNLFSPISHSFRQSFAIRRACADLVLQVVMCAEQYCTATKRSLAFAARPPVAPCRTNAQTGDLLSAPRCLPCVQAARAVMRAALWPGKARLRYSGTR